MEHISENYRLKCNFDLYYFDDIVDYMKKHEKAVLSFFGIKKLEKPCTIEIMNWSDFEKFQLEKIGQVRDFVRGNTDLNSHSIKVLLLEDQIKYTTHKKATLEDTLKTVLHEFVHICHASVQTHRPELIWFFEGIATNLAKNNYEIVDLHDCDFEKLKNDFRHYGKGRYKYSYTIVHYILNNYDKGEIDRFIYDTDYLIEQSDRLFEEVKKNRTNESSM